ncbi:hypothetical protein AVEN_34193-1 [Araneus ventricosus]|uniref:Uncharacterized protein n=1 Tax=Araneus ventricosus TaxID=182803 RepID=A0A4Y2GJ85_ARAVE|nr:hypothetical protein AVEN_34193-1 [Araneus ventricosus]
MDAVHPLVEFNSLKHIASPLDSLPGVFFHTKLLTHTDKSPQHSENLRQAAFEVISNIPIKATVIYTLKAAGIKLDILIVGFSLSMVGVKLLLNEEMLTTAQFSTPKLSPLIWL